MKKNVIKITTGIVVFVISTMIISMLMNQGNTDMTADMQKASFPLVYINSQGEKINGLHGYVGEMQDNFIRDSITPLLDNRQLEIQVDKYNNEITSLSYEVRSVDGERLVEKTEVTGYTEENDVIHATLNIKDLIDPKTEYNLIVLLQTNSGKTIKYYTRIVQAQDYHSSEKIAFVKNFHNKTFDKVLAEELTTYLESNADGDNTTYGKVTIHSSFDQITWGSLAVKKETEPEIKLLELEEETASIELSYLVSIGSGNEKEVYRIREYYRLRYGTERIFLLDFERTMDQIFSKKSSDFVNNKIILGITNSNTQMLESADGNVLAFVQENKLFSYNITDQKFSFLFGFYDDENMDTRSLYDDHQVKILTIEETGNVRFLVYGYMNRGNHEGEVGVQVNYYDSAANTTEEEIFIPYDKSFSLLNVEMNQLSYVNKSDVFYMILEGNLYSVNLMDKSYEVIAKNLDIGNFKVSDSNRMVVWQEGTDHFHCKKMIMMNLNSKNKVEIASGGNESLMPLGFMVEDLIYGIAYDTDILKDHSGSILFPMYTLQIQNEKNEILERYIQNGIYITSAQIKDNQINLKRVTKNENALSYTNIADDQIMNNEAADPGRNVIEVVATNDLEKIVQIELKNTIEYKKIKFLTPKQVIFEGGRTISMALESTGQSRYYVYGQNGIENVFIDPGDALTLADEISGAVVNDKGAYIWKVGTRKVKNQIMKIEAATVTEEKNSVAVCLDSILKFEGVSKNSEMLLAQGETVQSILAKNLEDAEVLELSGCTLDSVLYYLDKEIPVMAMLTDGNAVLIVGYNELNTVIMDPNTGTIYKKGMNDSKLWFEENGNRFITYSK